jgi:hypothetical protein
MKSVATFLLFGPFYERFSQVPLLERFQKMDPKLGATGYSAEVDDMVNGVTAQILHLPPRRRGSRRRGSKCKICVLSLLFWFV